MHTQKKTGLPTFYSSQEAGRAVAAFSQDQKRNAAAPLRWGIPSLDEAGVPLRYPGCCYVWQGRSHHGKSLFSSHIISTDVATLALRPPTNGMIDIEMAVLTEQTVEQQAVQRWRDDRVSFRRIVSGNETDEAIAAVAACHAGDPVVTVGFAAGGHAVLPPGVIARQRIDTDDLHEIVASLKREGLRVVSVVIDMINRMSDRHGARDLPQRIENICMDVQDFASSTGLPVVLTAQSVIRGASGFPGFEDIAGNSDIARTAEAMFGVWKPNIDKDVQTSRNGSKGSVVKIDGRDVVVVSNMIALKCLKYRNATHSSAGESIVDREMLFVIDSHGGLHEKDLKAGAVEGSWKPA